MKITIAAGIHIDAIQVSFDTARMMHKLGKPVWFNKSGDNPRKIVTRAILLLNDAHTITTNGHGYRFYVEGTE